jgi:hypothetical protein
MERFKNLKKLKLNMKDKLTKNKVFYQIIHLRE